MALDNSDDTFPDSDDEDSGKKKQVKQTKSISDPFHASLCFKSAKVANASLYYVDHTKLKNNGNGLDPADRNDLASNLAKAESEELALKEKLKSMGDETLKLQSEPTNEEAIARLETEELALTELMSQVEAARKLKVNEKIKQKLKKSIAAMAAEWRKRRRICMDFLTTMEEITEGTVSRKKCLAGDGQVDIDSDEAVVKAAVEFASKKRKFGSNARAIPSKKKRKVSDDDGLGGVDACAAFVAVTLDSQGCIKRVFIGEGAE